ncbi:MAG: hypothetical protein ACKVX7_14560 [Planctomycetota bacterium]
MRSALLLLLFGGVLLLHLWLTWVNPTSDPASGYSNDHAFNTDGYWYLAEAKAWVAGGDAQVAWSYNRPLISYPAVWIFSLGGVGYATARVLSSFASLLAIALLGAALGKKHGPAAALVGATLLALDPSWLTHVRSPLIYVAVATWIFATIWLASGARWWRWIAGCAFLMLGGVCLKSLVFAAAPALLVDGWRRLRCAEVRAHAPNFLKWGLVGGAAALGGLSLWLAPRFWRMISVYLWGDGFVPIEQLLSFETRSRLFSALPALVALAAVHGVLGLRYALPSDETARRFASLAHWTVWSVIVTFAVGRYTPLRYLMVVVPLLAYLAGALVDALMHSNAWTPRVVAKRWQYAALALTTFASAYALSQVARAIGDAAIPGVVVGAVAAAVIVVGGATARRWCRLVQPTAMPVFVLALALVAGAAPLARVTAARPDTLGVASRDLAAIVLPTAVIIGPYAHALCFESELRAVQVNGLRFGGGQLRARIQALAGTHLLTFHDDTPEFRGLFERDGVALESVEHFQVRGRTVTLFRFVDATIPRSAFEEGVAALLGGDLAAAETAFAHVVKGAPNAAPAWARLAMLAERRGDSAAAFECYQRAVACDPARLEAHIALANLYGAAERLDLALEHLRAASAAAPANEHLREQARNLAARLTAERSQ